MAKKDNKYTKTISNKSQVFGLGRPLNLGETTTRQATLLALISGVCFAIWRTIAGDPSATIGTFAVAAGANVFFSFFIAQELDPEPSRKICGLIGAVLTVVGQVVWGAGSITVLIWALFVLRLLNRSSGSRHQIGDNAIIILMAFWLGKEGFWIYPIVTGVAYIIESQIKGGYYRSLYISGLAFATAAMAVQTGEKAVLSVSYLWLMGITCILLLPEITMANYTTAKGDQDGVRLIPQRLQTAQGFMMVSSFLLAWFQGDEAAKALVPVWMAASGCGIYLLFYLIKNKKENRNLED